MFYGILYAIGGDFMRATPNESNRRFESRSSDAIHFKQFRESTNTYSPILKGQHIRLRANVPMFTVWFKPILNTNEFVSKIFPTSDDTFLLLQLKFNYDGQWVYILEHIIYGKVEFYTHRIIEQYFEVTKKK